jgi:hypothetical protein
MPGSLLLTETIRQSALGSQLSVALAAMVTGIRRWFGGHNEFGVALTALIFGVVVSTTVTVAVQVDVSP